MLKFRHLLDEEMILQGCWRCREEIQLLAQVLIRNSVYCFHIPTHKRIALKLCMFDLGARYATPLNCLIYPPYPISTFDPFTLPPLYSHFILVFLFFCPVSFMLHILLQSSSSLVIAIIIIIVILITPLLSLSSSQSNTEKEAQRNDYGSSSDPVFGLQNVSSVVHMWQDLGRP